MSKWCFGCNIKAFKIEIDFKATVYIKGEYNIIISFEKEDLQFFSYFTRWTSAKYVPKIGQEKNKGCWHFTIINRKIPGGGWRRIFTQYRIFNKLNVSLLYTVSSIYINKSLKLDSLTYLFWKSINNHKIIIPLKTILQHRCNLRLSTLSTFAGKISRLWGIQKPFNCFIKTLRGIK